jgi:hypothetical protein
MRKWEREGRLSGERRMREQRWASLLRKREDEHVLVESLWWVAGGPAQWLGRKAQPSVVANPYVMGNRARGPDSASR